jgi:N-acetylmuramoyl-L-alanine amidase
VLKRGESLICLLLLLTGCSTGWRQTKAPVPRDWRAAPPAKPGQPQTEKVAEAPRLAPPPSGAPEPPGSSKNPVAGTWVSLERWSRENGLGPMESLSSSTAPVFAIHTTNGLLLVHLNNLVADWEGVEFHLGFEPRLISGVPSMYSLDLKKNMEPLLTGFSPSTKTNRTVVIDPGHGGQNTGTISVTDNVYEKDYTLDWARRLAPLLTANGWQVVLTRTNDQDIALSNRVAVAEEHRADLFISLHFNSAAPNEEQAGLETYCLTPAGMPSTLTRGYDDDSSQVFANNAFDALNIQYAFLLHRNLLPVVGGDRGVRHARFLGVLRGQNRPAVLIEGGYLSNPEEAHRIADPGYRQELAEAVAQALAPKADIKHPPASTANADPENHRPTRAVESPPVEARSTNPPAANLSFH